MLQVSGFMIYITRQINTPEKRAFWMLAGALLCAVLFYAYSIQMTIHAIVERADIMRNAKELTTELGSLESEYNTVRKTLTYEHARALGFGEAKDQSFAKRTRLASAEVFSD